MTKYEIVRVRKKWEVRADGVVKATFDSKSDAVRAARRLFEMPTSIGRAHDDSPGPDTDASRAMAASEHQNDARRRTARPGSRRRTTV